MKWYILSLLLLSAAPAVAQREFEYSANFLCGKASGEIVKSFAHSPGVYYTAINISNLNREVQVKGVKRFAVSLRAQKQVRNTKFLEWSVDPATAMQVNCGDIYAQFDIEPGKFIEGSVYIVGGPVRFDVAAVYTLFDGNYPASIDVEHLMPR